MTQATPAPQIAAFYTIQGVDTFVIEGRLPGWPSGKVLRLAGKERRLLRVIPVVAERFAVQVESDNAK